MKKEIEKKERKTQRISHFRVRMQTFSGSPYIRKGIFKKIDDDIGRTREWGELTKEHAGMAIECVWWVGDMMVDIDLVAPVLEELVDWCYGYVHFFRDVLGACR